MYYIFLQLILGILCFIAPQQCCAEEFVEPNTGTLVISYQTGIHGERLDRIRFTLSNGKLERQMYPKKNRYVDDVAKLTRLVIIEDLSPGQYQIEFIVPNSDGLFEEVPLRTVTIEKGKTEKIDQLILVRYARLKATSEMQGQTFLSKIYPTITLKDSDGNEVMRSHKGSLTSSTILPGEYLIVFEPLPGYLEPSPQPITLMPREEAPHVHGIYQPKDPS